MRRLLEISKEGTVLVLVDLQEEHRRDSRFLAADFDEVLGNVAKLLGAAREHGVPVIHVAYVRNLDRVPRRKFEPMGEGGEPLFSNPDLDLTEICPEVAPLKGEKVFHKNDASSFSDPDFAAEITRLDPEWVLVCGAWTEACVAATVRDATKNELRALLVKDACASGTKTMHQSAVLNLANRMYGGGIADTKTTVELIAGVQRDVWLLEGTTPIRFDADTIEEHFNAL